MILTRKLLLCFILKYLVISCSSFKHKPHKPPPPAPPAPPKYTMFCDVPYKIPGMKKLPKYCTGLASSNDTIGSPDDIGSLKKGKMVFMRYVRGKSYSQWQTDLVNEATVDTFTVTILNQGIRYICFDHLYPGRKTRKVDVEGTAKIIKFLDELKSQNPLVKVGIALPKHKDYLHNAFNLLKLDEHVDFYLLKAHDYRVCEYHTFRSDFRRTTEKDIDESIQNLVDEKYNLKKVLLLMDINAYSHNVMKLTWHTSKHYATLPFYDICSKPFSRHRTMCLDTLQQFYNKADKVRENNMMGLYVQYATFDDVKGNCQCEDETGSAEYPVLNILSRALTGVRGGDLLACDSWAEPPRK